MRTNRTAGGVGERRRRGVGGDASPGVVLSSLIALVSLAAGCRSGAGAFTAPKWWSFGGGKPVSTFAAAPVAGQDAAGDPVKPSTTSAPYPSTSTPGAYNLAGAGNTPGGAPAAIPAAPSAVTYGSTPPSAVGSVATASGAAGNNATPAAQVGPYSLLPGATPAAPAAVAGAPAAFPETAGYEPSRRPDAEPAPGSRFAAQPAAPPPTTLTSSAADSRFQAPAASPPPAATIEPAVVAATVAAPVAAAATSRYGDTAATSVPSGSAADGPAASRYASATAASRFGGTPPSGADAPPAAAGAMAPPPAVAPPVVPPPAAPEPHPPAGFPGESGRGFRRPDPAFRPAGTSSYQPSSALLADAPPAAPVAPAVQPATFETDAASPRDE